MTEPVNAHEVRDALRAILNDLKPSAPSHIDQGAEYATCPGDGFRFTRGKFNPALAWFGVEVTRNPSMNPDGQDFAVMVIEAAVARDLSGLTYAEVGEISLDQLTKGAESERRALTDQLRNELAAAKDLLDEDGHNDDADDASHRITEGRARAAMAQRLLDALGSRARAAAPPTDPTSKPILRVAFSAERDGAIVNGNALVAGLPPESLSDVEHLETHLRARTGLPNAFAVSWALLTDDRPETT